MMTTINGVMTGVLIVVFIAIWIWAWSSKNNQAFDDPPHLPLEDDPSVNPGSAGEKNHE